MTSTPLLFCRSLLFNICYISWAMLSAIIFAPLFIISPRAALLAGPPWAGVVLWLARVLCGIRYEVRGKEYAVEGPYIYASKHQSAWETAFFLTQFKRPSYILKRELLRIPLWVWYLWRMQMIYIDRHAGVTSMKDMIRQSKAAIFANRPIIIFPEGTRTKPASAPVYHPGVIALYNQLKVPVIPVALNSGVFWGKDAFIKRSGTIVVEFLPPIPTGLGKEEFASRLQNTIESASAKLLAETQAVQP